MILNLLEMGTFSRVTRIRALVAAARHCCVCHRYKGVKVEVHHIVPQSEGGADDFDNAIPLCFDCHTDAGHYNPRHPRGTRFSSRELRTHRDSWYEIVRRNQIRSPEDEDVLYCRYLVCRSFEALREITVLDFTNMPIPNCMLAENAVLQFQRYVVEAHGREYRHSHEWGEAYPTRDEFWKAHPEAEEINRSRRGYPYFEVFRKTSMDEVRERVCPSDGVTRLLIEAGVALNEVVNVLAHWDECGPNRVQESYRLRPLLAVYLVVTNVSDKPVILQGLDAVIEHVASLGYRPFERPTRDDTAILPMPAPPVPPGTTVIIPLATLLGPFEDVDSPIWSGSEQQLASGQYQEVTHTSFENARPAVNAIGPVIWTSGIRLKIAGIDQLQGVHDLDLSNVYALNRFWAMGCCPHLFFRNSQTGVTFYAGEIFSRQPFLPSLHEVMVPDQSDEILIAELEHEETYICGIYENQSVVVTRARLRKGEVLRLKVTPGALLRLEGFYVPDNGVGGRVLDPWRKNELIARFRAEAAHPRWVEDVRAHKLTIVSGEGVVDGHDYYPEEQCGIRLKTLRQ